MLADYFYCACPIMLALAFHLQSEQTAVFSLLQKKKTPLPSPRMTVPCSLFICDYIQSTYLLLHCSFSQHRHDNQLFCSGKRKHLIPKAHIAEESQLGYTSRSSIPGCGEDSRSWFGQMSSYGCSFHSGTEPDLDVNLNSALPGTVETTCRLSAQSARTRSAVY